MENTTDRAELIHRTMGLAMHSMRMHHRIVEKRMEAVSAGVHPSHHRTLMILSRMGCAASQKDIAREMNVTPACIARALKSLAQAGMVDRAEAEQDNRCNEVRLSQEGMQVVNESREIFRKLDLEMYEGFTDEEIMQMNALMQRLNRNLAKMDSCKTDSE